MAAKIKGYIRDPVRVTGHLRQPEREDVPAYTGPYTVTPTEETQVLSTQGKKMSAAVTVEPIPTNYGLITWDGTKIRVS